MILRNEDVTEVRMEVPEGHRHLRTTLVLVDGTEIVLQEATVANLVRGYITLKTHPVKERIVLKGVFPERLKKGYAAWQLLDE